MMMLAGLGVASSARAERPERERPDPGTSVARTARPEPAAPPGQLEDSGGEPPAGYQRVERMRSGLVVSGVSMFVLSFAPAAYIGISAASCDPGDNPNDSDRCMFPKRWASVSFPVVGPLMFSTSACRGDAACTAVLVSDGLAQAAGLALFAYGLSRRTVFERKDGRRDAPPLALFGCALPGGGMIGVAGALF